LALPVVTLNPWSFRQTPVMTAEARWRPAFQASTASAIEFGLETG